MTSKVTKTKKMLTVFELNKKTLKSTLFSIFNKSTAEKVWSEALTIITKDAKRNHFSHRCDIKVLNIVDICHVVDFATKMNDNEGNDSNIDMNVRYWHKVNSVIRNSLFMHRKVAKEIEHVAYLTRYKLMSTDRKELDEVRAISCFKLS